MDLNPVALSAILVIFTGFYVMIKNGYNYWKKKKIPYIEPNFFFGNYKDYLFQREYIGETDNKICKRFPNEPFVGAYLGTKPLLILKDPEIIKLITTKEFQYFESRELMDYSNKEPFGRGLILAHGDDWKFTRTNLTPMFSTMKLKNMFHLIEKCSIEFEDYLDTHIKSKPVEARNLMAKFTMFCFVSCAFGIELKDYSKKNEFLVMGDKFFDVDCLRGFILNMRNIYPSLFYRLGFRNIPTEVSIFFGKLMTDVFESRNYKASPRNDFVDALLNLKENAEKKNGTVDKEYIIAQSLAIFAGGFETSATTLGFLLYEIAKSKDIQAKVHEEIHTYLKKTNGSITFECMTDLPCLDACIDETLRKYPIAGILNREVSKEYTMPSGVVLEKGLRIHIPLYYLHRNPEYFPEPEVFRPERFYGENKQNIVPYSYIPFGEGPRVCIGKRFAKMQMMPGLIAVLRNHNVVLEDGMPTELEFDSRSITTQSKSGIHVRFVPRS